MRGLAPPHLPRCSLAASPGQSLIPQPDLLLLIQAEFPPDPIKHLAASEGCPRFHRDVTLYFCTEPTLESWGEKEKEVPWGGKAEEGTVFTIPSPVQHPCCLHVPWIQGCWSCPTIWGQGRHRKAAPFLSQCRHFSTFTAFLRQRALVFPQNWSRACGCRESVISAHIQPGKPRDPLKVSKFF